MYQIHKWNTTKPWLPNEKQQCTTQFQTQVKNYPWYKIKLMRNPYTIKANLYEMRNCCATTQMQTIHI